MNDNEFDSKDLSEQFDVETPPAVRSLDTVEAELRIIQNQAQRAVLGYAIEAGQRLEEAKAMVNHGEWGGWLKKMGYAKSTAQNLMRIYREYGASQQSIFGGEAKSQAFGNLTYSKALKLLALPSEEDREQFIAEHDVEDMSTRELDKALKEREEELKWAKAHSDAVEKRNKELEAERKQAMADMRKASGRAIDLESELKAAQLSAQAAEEKHARLLQELEKLRSRPVEVAVEVDTKAVEAAREAAVAEMTERVEKAESDMKTADTARKAAEDAFAAAQRELDELKSREPQVRELTPEEKAALTADAVEKARAGDLERVKELEKQLAFADGDTASFKVFFEAWQDNYWKMKECMKRIAEKDLEKSGKLQEAVQAAVERMGM